MTSIKLNVVKDVQQIVKRHFGIIKMNYSEEDNGRRCNIENITLYVDIEEDMIEKETKLSGYGSVWNTYRQESRFDSLKLIDEILTYIELGYHVYVYKKFNEDYSYYKI